MAPSTTGRKSLLQQMKEILEQPVDSAAQDPFLSELRMSVEQYEKRYGIPTQRVHDAIEAGELVEDVDVGHWIFQYDLLQSVEKG